MESELMANDTQGRLVPDDGADTIAYNSDGTISTITRVVGATTWIQTYTYTSGSLTNISGWVKQ